MVRQLELQGKIEKVTKFYCSIAIFHLELFLQDIKSSQSSEDNVTKATELGGKDDDDLIPTSNTKSGDQLIEDNIIKSTDKSDDLFSKSGY